MATAGRLRQALTEYKDDEPLLWQFYSSDHAAIPADKFREVAEALHDSQVFMEDLHEFISEWMERTYERIEHGGPQLSYGELANLTHRLQVEYYGFCTCEDGPKVYDDCTEGGSE
jgi:hypothetical protein